MFTMINKHRNLKTYNCHNFYNIFIIKGNLQKCMIFEKKKF